MKKPSKPVKKAPTASLTQKRPAHPPQASRVAAKIDVTDRKQVASKKQAVTAKAPKKSAGPAPPARSSPANSAEAAVLASAAKQEQVFEKAIGFFRGQEYARARKLFEEAAAGPSRVMAHSARLHMRMCEHRMEPDKPVLSSPEDLYNYAIALINRRELDTAEQQLKQALGQMADGDHLHYALALCRGLIGDFQGAYLHLKKAIELQPRNRLTARNDPDFHPFAHHSPIRDLLFP
jgi:tetratricopeptide (TPR) repeat protein